MIFTDSFKKDFRFYCESAFIFSFIVGIGYLIGYWWSLGINIFPFLSLFDLLKCAACPFLILFVLFVLIRGLFVEFSLLSSIEKYTNKLTVKIKKNPRKSMLIGAVIGLLYFYAAITIGIHLKLTFFSIGLPIAFILILSWLRHKIKERAPEADSISRAYGRWLMLLCLLPLVSYDYGKHKATAILKEKKYSYTWISEEDENDEKGQKELYKYLGFVNEHYFFINKNNRTLIVNNDLENLKLYRY